MLAPDHDTNEEGISGPEKESLLRRALFGVATTLALLASLAGVSIIGYGVYVFVTPERLKEKHAIESFLGVPPVRRAPGARGSAAPAVAAPRESATGSAASAAVPPPAASVAPPTPPAVAASAEAPGPPANPWVPMPPALARLAAKVNRGRILDKRELATLHQYNAKHASDSRGHILIARSHLKRKWVKDSANEYEAAFHADPGATGDPRMLSDLLSLVGSGSEEAGKLLISAYGEDAAPAIDLELSKRTLKPVVRARLERLRREIPSKIEAH